QFTCGRSMHTLLRRCLKLFTDLMIAITSGRFVGCFLLFSHWRIPIFLRIILISSIHFLGFCCRNSLVSYSNLLIPFMNFYIPYCNLFYFNVHRLHIFVYCMILQYRFIELIILYNMCISFL
ncbi:hypothetical protein L9F63_019581, partial [Diploptera punctata]